MAGSSTYNGSKFRVSLGVPPTNDVAGFESLTWVEGECTLREVPAFGESDSAVEDDLVCRITTVKVPGPRTYNDVSLTMARRPSDAIQEALKTLNASGETGSIAVQLPLDQGTLYTKIKVGNHSPIQGGSSGTIIDRMFNSYPQDTLVESPNAIPDTPVAA